jgi:hypothetical protein
MEAAMAGISAVRCGKLDGTMSVPLVRPRRAILPRRFSGASGIRAAKFRLTVPAV